MAARPLRGAVQRAGERAVEDVVDEGGLAGAGHAGHRRRHAEGEADVDPLQVVLARALDRERLARARAAQGGRRDLLLPRQVPGRQRVRKVGQLLRLPLRHDPPSVHAGARPQVQDPVGGADRLLVVLDDDDRVAQVAHREERVDQLAVVALVETDRRLVQDVEHSHQLRADLGREADPLRLAPRERRRAAREVQVPDPHVGEEAQPVADLLQDLPRDLLLPGGEMQLLEERDRVGDRVGGDLVDGAPAHLDRERLGLQAAARATRARLGRHVRLQLRTVLRVLRLAVAALEHRDEPLERGAPVVLPLLRHVGELDLVLPGAVQDHLARGLRQLREGLVQPELVVLRQHAHLAGAPVGGPGFHDRDRPVGDRFLRRDDDAVRVGLQDRPEAGALLAGAVGRVEREEARGDLGQRGAAVGARVIGGEDLLGTVRDRDRDEAAGDSGGGLDRVGQALLVFLVGRGLGNEAVDDELDRVLLLLVQLGRVLQVMELPVDPGAQEALLEHLRHLLPVLPLLARNVGGEHGEAAPLGEAQGLVHHLLDRLRLDRPAAAGAVGLADRGVEEAQVVVDLRDRADGRAGVLRGRALFDRNGRGKPFDRIHVRLFHLLQELPGVGRQGLHVPPLPFREDRVEGERRLARARDTGDHHQAVARHVAGDVSEVVLPRPADPEEFHGPDSTGSPPPLSRPGKNPC